MSTPTFGKPQTNPFGLADVGFVNKPTLADLDGDEDLDLLVGESNGNLIYHENQSTASAPTFGTPQTTSFGLANSDVYSSPTFADIDADGDLDIFVGGSHPHMMTYQENQGTASSPTFGTLQTNPFGLAHVNSFSSPTLADLDGDEDLDLLVGNYHGNLIYQENEGTAKAPTFGKPQTNPFGLVDVGVGNYSSPTLADLDGDEDLDLLVGNYHGNLIYQENKGTAKAPTFGKPQTNPFGLTNVGIHSSPTLADLDGDEDLDLLVGNFHGNLIYFKNQGTASSSTLLNVNDYAALKALYTSTDGENWKTNTGWDVSRETPPSADVVNGWHGVTVEEGRVTKIELNKNDLSGMLPSELGSLSNLQKLRLQSNDLSGTLPSELGSLSNLQDLGLYNNDLSGTLPSWLGDLSNLQFLGLSKNDLSGTLPSWLGDLSNLQQLGLAKNDLSGTLPSELGSLSNLQYLYLDNSSLSGTLPSELGSLSNLQHLWLHNNDLSGTLPESIKDLSAEKRLENPPYVEIPIPDYEAVTGESFFFDISNHFSDINDNITNYSAEGLPTGLTIDSNSGKIGGTPTTEGTFTVTVTASDEMGGMVQDEFNIDVRLTLDANDYAALKALYTSTDGENWRYNTGWDFSRETPPDADVVDGWHAVTVEEGRVTKINLYDNSLSGSIPSELGDLSNLQILDLGRNDLSGSIPSELGDLSNLEHLYLENNSLSGEIPSELGDLSNLQFLDLYNNDLSGTLPESIKDLSAEKRLENPPYVESPIPDVDANYGEEFDLNVSTHFSDINDNITNYSAEGLPTGLTIDSNSGEIGGTLTTEGSFPVTVTVSDTAGGVVKDEFNIVVSSPPTFGTPQTNPFEIAGVPGSRIEPTIVQPTFADLDQDGDLDLLIGNTLGSYIYQENQGNASSFTFGEAQTNPFELPYFEESHSSPTFADIDGDGDLDLFVGELYGEFIYRKNEGTASSPTFGTSQTNPFGLADIFDISSPAFADIDGDGDLDLFAGNHDGNIVYFKNNGTASSPTFGKGKTNPFGIADVGLQNNPTLADLDQDGDLDLLMGNFDGNLIYQENEGTASSPTFGTPQTNPFGIADVGLQSSPTLADLDQDGDLDLFVGNRVGEIIYFKNQGTAGSSTLLNADDYAALKALYTSTYGENWSNNTGWDFSRETPPDADVVDKWHGVTVEEDRVTKIELDYNSLSGSIPSELGDLSNLQSLDLSWNIDLSGSIPSELGDLSNLQSLYLGWNDLSGSIPSELGDLSNLQSLYLYNNDLSGEIPSELGDLSNLHYLDLSNSSLSGEIPSELGDLSNLHYLGLYNSSLSGEIPSELGDLSNLQVLDLSNNDLSGTIPNSINELSAAKILENPPYVKTPIDDVQIYLHGNVNIDVSGNFGDINDNITDYRAKGLPNGLTIDSSGAIGGTPTTEGTFTVTVTALDQMGRMVEDEFNIDVRGTLLQRGGDSSNNIDGTPEDDTLFGEGGHDQLRGVDGDDYLNGGYGRDSLFGGNGHDMLDGGVGYGHDSLWGGNGNDTLIGGKGHDTLIGGTGNDEMTGGKGADLFVFESNSGVDTIIDFDSQDSIELRSDSSLVWSFGSSDSWKWAEGNGLVFGNFHVLADQDDVITVRYFDPN